MNPELADLLMFVLVVFGPFAVGAAAVSLGRWSRRPAKIDENDCLLGEHVELPRVQRPVYFAGLDRRPSKPAFGKRPQ